MTAEYQDYPWTAKICRSINGLEESEQSVRYCGQCVDYANIRKRIRASKLPMLLPGFEEIGGSYQLHQPCWRLRFRDLQSVLRGLEHRQIVVRYPKSKIPDPCQPRGWDFGTRWRIIE